MLVSAEQEHNKDNMGLSSIYNSIKGGIDKAGNSLSSIFESKPVTIYNKPMTKQSQVQASKTEPKYNIPPVIAEKHRPMFIEQAKLAGVTPDEFGMIARREQGPTTLPNQAAMVGTADPTDKGVMQVNEMNNDLIKERFRNEIGREYNPYDPRDSIIAARMVLEENRRQLEQMKVNQSFMGDYSGKDLVDTYNTGVRGWVEAQNGNPERKKRLLRYQEAG